MKNIVLLATALLLTLTVRSQKTQAQEQKINTSKLKKSTTMENQSVKNEIEKSLAVYFDALNKSSVDQAIGQYTPDGIFMGTGLPTATGKSELKKAYENIFKAIQLNVTFKVEEVVSLGDNVAFVRTQSNGSQVILANGKKTEEINREFFLMKNENGIWKIARYMFNQPK